VSQLFGLHVFLNLLTLVLQTTLLNCDSSKLTETYCESSVLLFWIYSWC